MRFKKVFLALGLFLGILVSNSFSLEPRLLWKMELKEMIGSIDFAKRSGDLIFSHGKEFPNTITLVNKEGKIIWQWGPNLEKVAISISISDDGTKFAFLSSFELYKGLEKGYEENYIHYYDREKGEIWKRNLDKSPLISPDGKYILAERKPSEDPYTFLLDEMGRVLWKKKCGGYTYSYFSPDSKFIVCFPYIIDLSGKVYTNKASGDITSVTENAEYFGLTGVVSEKEGIYTKNGELVFKGKNIISANESIVLKIQLNKIEVYKFPEMIKKRELPIKCSEYSHSEISYEGRIIAIFGSRMDRISKTNLFLIDTNSNTYQELLIPNVETGDSVIMHITWDGKFLCICHKGKIKTLFYYFQIY